MTKSCSTCRRHLGLGQCAGGYETICKGEMWLPVIVHDTAIDAARYVDHVEYQGDFTVTRRPDGKYDLKLEGYACS